jgi:hypothetical protein
VRAGFETVLCCHDNDVAGFLKQVTDFPEKPLFDLALLRGKLQEAASSVDRIHSDKALTQYGLLYLAAVQAKNQKLADEQWPHLLDSLKRTNRYTRQLGALLGNPRKVDGSLVLRLPIDPRQKRVLLAVVATRYPDQGKELLPLARQLNFYQDVTSLCLHKVLGE